MTRRAVVAVAVLSALAAVAAVGLGLASVGAAVPWGILALVAAAEAIVATAGAWWTYTRHEQLCALSGDLARVLSRMPGAIVWAVDRDGRILWLVGGALRQHWPEVAPRGVLLSSLHLSAWGYVPERDEGLARAWSTGSSSWESDTTGVSWMSWAVRSRDGDAVAVLTVDASQVRAAVRADILDRALGGGGDAG